MANKPKPQPKRAQASAGKSNPKAAPKGKGSLPKSKTMKPRGSTTQKQVGDMNQRERYNQQREEDLRVIKSNRAFGNNPKATALEKKIYGKSVGGTSASGSGSKVSTAQVKKQNAMKSKVGKKGYYLDKNGSKVYPGANETTTAYNSQRAGGKVGSRTAGKSNPTARKKLKGPKGS